MNFSSFKPDTENNANVDAVSSKHVNFDEVQCFLKKHIPKQIIFGTHDRQTFKYNTGTLINKLLLLQFYLFNIRPKLHHRKWRKLCVTLIRTFSTSLAACWCCSSSNLYPELCCYKLPSIVTFTFIHTFDQNFVFFTEQRHVDRQCDALIFKIRVIFGVRFERLKSGYKANLEENWSIQTPF